MLRFNYIKHIIKYNYIENLKWSRYFQKSLSTTSSTSLNQDPYLNLKISEIQQLLQDAKIDFRDCYEKNELIQRLKESESSFPAPIRNKLKLILRNKTIDPNLGKTAPTERLYLDEEHTVNLFNNCKHSVVHVTSYSSEILPFSMDPINIPKGSGSGFVWDDLGHIITNLHVVKEVNEAHITLSDNKRFTAKVKGIEADKDLAILKIEPKSHILFPIQVGLSNNLEVGQRVYAIGNPFGLDQTLTAGIISGLGREIVAETGRKIRDVIQTDAAINPGNSGGPLLDSSGRLVGVTTAIVSPGSGTFAGIGFAIPSNTVRRVVNQILKHGKVIKPRLGLFCASSALDLSALTPGINGIIVIDVERGSPADSAGIKGMVRYKDRIEINDIIIEIGGIAVNSIDDLSFIVEEFDIGDLVPITILRNTGNNFEKLNLTIRTI